MTRRALYILGCLLLLSSACGSGDSEQSNSEFDLIDHIDLNEAELPDAGERDVELEDAGPDATKPDSGPGGVDLGEACGDDEECNFGRCIDDPGFVGGYCSTPDACEFDDQCPEGSTCFQDGETNFCGARCEATSDCRDGYSCQESSASPFKACAPIPTTPSEGAVDGAACDSDSDCAGSYCLKDPEWPGGYCTTVDCQTYVDCARGPDEANNRCLQQPGGTNFCVRMCQRSADCREDYVCSPVGGGQGFCSPDPQADFAPEGLEDYPFDITCGLEAENNRIHIDYEIAADTTSYMITPFALDRKSIRIASTTLPDSGQIDFSGANDFQTVPALLFDYVNPTLTPPVAQMADQLQSGAHTLQVRTDSTDLCYYVLEENSPGVSIDFNIYLVGIGLSAEQAETDPNLQAMLDHFDAVYAQFGVTTGEVRYHEITGDDADAYQIVRTELDLQKLVSLSTLPEGGYDAALSANVFFVRGMQLGGGGGGAIGVSQGLPGAAALHGTPSSGVIFTSEYLGMQFQGEQGSVVNGNEFTGIVMAHEVGHYLGLFHTSEQYGQGFDPVLDTPRCTRPSDFPDNCPDINNLMFPLAGISHTELTPGQIFTLQANPLTKD